MPCYADSSLLFKLYIREPESPTAIHLAQTHGPGIAFTPLHHLEITTSMRRLVGQGKLTVHEAARALSDLRRDLHAGLYHRPLLDWPRVFQQAHRLSQRHSRKLLMRSLDLLHLSAALELGAADFLSLDTRQRQAAKAEGLNVLP